MIPITSGKSEKDRITYYSGSDGISAIKEEDGTITLKHVEENVAFKKALIVFLVFFVILSIIKVLFIVPAIKNNSIGIIWYFIPTFFYVILSIWSIYNCRKNLGINGIKNHGAEHKVNLAYLKLKRVPNIDEAKSFSRINKACGIIIFSSFIISQLICFIIFIISGYYIIPEIVLFILTIFLQTCFPFNLLGKLAQFFTTSEPEEENLELAISSLSKLVTYVEFKNILLGKLAARNIINNSKKNN